VYHAAAYKHVPLVEHNPVEGIRNNVLGTLCAAQAALECGVANFVLISTDKAVRPTNIMGASKRLAEMVLQALAANGSQTTFSIVRFGNVLGSSGSVVPKFRQQIREGGPIALTHPEITRYFMTIPEASQLVIQAGAMATGGEVYVLDMGEPVRIIDLARRMVELSGLTLRDELNPDGDIEIEITGLRPGEKLYEELLIGDNPMPTEHAKILMAQEGFLQWPLLRLKLQALETALDASDIAAIRELLVELVSGYTCNPDIVDWVYLERATQVHASCIYARIGLRSLRHTVVASPLSYIGRITGFNRRNNSSGQGGGVIYGNQPAPFAIFKNLVWPVRAVSRNNGASARHSLNQCTGQSFMA